MRIVTRPDFDGVVCAVLLREAINEKLPIFWAEPGDMQHGLVDVQAGDIVANLPFHDRCAMWFDHHYSNVPGRPFEGAFELAPSAAGLVHRYFADRLTTDFDELIRQTDKIDAAALSEDEVQFPENYPYVLLSMTVSGRDPDDEPYWNRLVTMLGAGTIDAVMADPDVHQRCRLVVEENRAYRDLLRQHTTVKGVVAVTDFRALEETPKGNRFLVYSMFPETVVQMKIRLADRDRGKVIVSLGHSIFNRNCRVNVGALLSRYQGGGHPGAGSCSFHVRHSDDTIQTILDVLMRNEPIPESRPGGGGHPAS
ncbi:MAG: exopolyphosphatase [Desulfobacteraceae bacterium]|nr:exopolyphosphatase [Desulfobacteraceae bacterium]MBC2751710.1 exopolyphosphatase [Desulfobacteraceae bacterium]